MSGLYNVVLGTHPAAQLLIAMLFGLDDYEEEWRKIPRFRDVYLYPDEIRILTRTGGGNREEYEAENEWMETIPGYLRNWDDEYDTTFAWWAYSWPEQHVKSLTAGLTAIQEQRPDLIMESNSIRERWEEAINNMKGPEH